MGRGPPLRTPSTTPDRGRLLVGASVLLACWAFPLVDVLTNEGGNVRTVLQASGSLQDETLGTGGAIDVLVQALAVRPVWAQAGAGPLDLLAPPSIATSSASGCSSPLPSRSAGPFAGGARR